MSKPRCANEEQCTYETFMQDRNSELRSKNAHLNSSVFNFSF